MGKWDFLSQDSRAEIICNNSNDNNNNDNTNNNDYDNDNNNDHDNINNNNNNNNDIVYLMSDRYTHLRVHSVPIAAKFVIVEVIGSEQTNKQ